MAEIFAATSRMVAKRSSQLADAADRADNRWGRMARVARARARRVPVGADLAADDWLTPGPLPVARPSAPSLPAVTTPAPAAPHATASHRPPPIPAAARPSAPVAIVGDDDWAAAILAAKRGTGNGAPGPANGPATSQTSASLQALRS